MTPTYKGCQPHTTEMVSSTMAFSSNAPTPFQNQNESIVYDRDREFLSFQNDGVHIQTSF